MSFADVCLIMSRGPGGEPVVPLGVDLLDDYLELLAGRCRSNTVLAVAYDLRLFFTVVGKAPHDVAPKRAVQVVLVFIAFLVEQDRVWRVAAIFGSRPAA